MHEFRPGLEIDVEALQEYLAARRGDLTGPLTVKQFADG